MEPPEQPPEPTPTRRARNAASQRLYRARQKARLEQLERLVVEAVAPSVASSTAAFAASTPPYSQSAQQPPQQLLGQENDQPPTGQLPSLGLSSYDIRSALTSCSQQERTAVRWIIINERFSMRDLVKFGLIHSGYAMERQLFDSAEDVSANTWLENVKSKVGDVDLKAVAIGGIRLLARLNVPWDQIYSDELGEPVSMGSDVAPVQPDLRSNCVLLSRESLAAAMFANASHLHIPIDNVIRDDAEYPTNQQDDVYRDLVPTATQLSVPHHPCFDTLPWAVFRSNICYAVAQEPPLIDDDDLCLDIMNEGIRCWGSTRQSLAGRGNGVPWDARSWEAAPWFLEKWEPLTGGKNSEMWTNSAWWRSLR